LLWSTVAAPGDLILLCSSPLARCLGRAGEDAWREWLLPADPDHALEGVARIAVERDLDEVLVAAVALGRAPVTLGGGRVPRLGLSRLGVRLPPLPAAPLLPRPRPAAGYPLVVAAPALSVPAPAGFAAAGAMARRSWAGVGVPLDRPLVAVVETRTAARRRHHSPLVPAHLRPVAAVTRPRIVNPAPPARALLIGLAERLLLGRRASVAALATRRPVRLTPAIRHMRRYRSAPATPAEWRAQLPGELKPIG
jgi:hypothetical protein